MQASVFNFSNGEWQQHPQHNSCDALTAQLVLCFASKKLLAQPSLYQQLKQQFPLANIAMCSTAGEIFHDRIHEDSLVAAALHFNHTPIEAAAVNVSDFSSSYDAAIHLVKKLPQKDLVSILVLSDGSVVNGSELVKGLNDAAGEKVLITGGLAGDGVNFASTLVGLNGDPAEGNIAAIGFYGEHILVTHGSKGGWQSFGLEKEVTRAEGNILFELDGKNALDIYKRYLGPEAEKLPASALLFPLSVTIPGSTQPLVRTILSIDHESSSMTFAGDIPVGSMVRLMKGNFDLITFAAAVAAQNTTLSHSGKPVFSLLVSCVGRKIILGSRTEEEVEAVIESLGEETAVAGFYSYGEISPFNEGGSCQLHNQTMTITSFYELA